MAESQQRRTALFLTIVLVGLNLIAANYLIAGWSAARLDLTQEGIFSISPSTRRILSSLDEDLTIYAYFSSRTHPKLAPLVPEIADLLDEYRAVSRGRVHVEILDPSRNDEVAKEAADRFGVQSTPFRLASKYESGIVNAFFALVIRYGDQYERYGFDELIQIDPLPDGDIDVRLRNLEYDLTRAIKKVVYGFRSTNELFSRVDQPISLLLIASPDSLPEVFAEVPETVRKAAAELQEAAQDKFIFEELDPTVDDVARAQVQTLYGLQPMSLGFFSDESFYLYGVLNVGGRLEQLVLTEQGLTAASVREAVESALRRNTPGFLKTIGIVAPSPMQLPPQLAMQMQQPPPEFNEIKRSLGEDYQVKDIRLDTAGGVPTDVDVLLVLKPSGMDEQAVYNLDQYLMRGGRVILCAGRYEADFGAEGLSVRPVETGLEAWLQHHGVSLEDTLVLDDRNQALPIPEIRHTALGAMRTWRLAPYPYLVQVREDGFVSPDITSTLDSVGIYWGSPLVVAEPVADGLQVLPILKSSERSWTDNDTGRVGYVDYEVPAEGAAPQLLAVALSGKFTSYFSDRPVPSAGTFDDEGAETASRPATIALKESPDTRMVVVGNAAFLSDFVARTIGQMDGGFFIENLRFIENTVDWISLDNDMLGIRARGLASRRLEETGRATQITVEALSYALPALILVLLGLNFFLKRRNASPLFETTGRRPAETLGAPHEEASS